MKAAVIGGNGFIGSHVVDRLIERGHSVTVFSRGPNPFRPEIEGVEYVSGTFEDGARLRKALRGADVVFHMVSTTIPSSSSADPLFDARTNVLGTIALLQACVDEGVGKLVFPSSGGTVYGEPGTIPIAEGHPTDPLNPYGVVKLAIEKYLAVYQRLFGLGYAILRVSNPYGPYQDPQGQQGVVAVFLDHVRRHQPITVWGDGNVVRDFVYVTDVADAFVAAASIDTSTTPVFNIGSGTGTNLRALLDMIGVVTGKEPIVEYRAGREIDVPVNILNIDRARAVLHWSPTISLPDGLERTWRWIQGLPVRRD